VSPPDEKRPPGERGRETSPRTSTSPPQTITTPLTRPVSITPVPTAVEVESVECGLQTLLATQAEAIGRYAEGHTCPGGAK
jgi:hypothetical protein